MIIDESAKASLIELRTNLFNDAVNDLALKVYSGDISIGSWQESMKKLIRDLHTATAAIGKGGWEKMTFADWGRLGTPLREQYAFLSNFAKAIADNRDTISLKQIQARARLYGKASGHSASLMQADPDILSQLPWLPKDGSTECLVGCKCFWTLKVIDVVSVVNGIQIVHAQWNLSDAEHCQDCIDRDGFLTVLTVPSGVDVPPRIGGFE